MEADFGKVLCERYNIVAYVTLLFVNPNGSAVKSGVGFYPADKFIALGKEAVEVKDLPTPDEKFIAGERSEEFLKTYLDAIANLRTPQAAKANSILDVLFAERGGELLKEKYFWDIYSKCATEINSSIALYVVQNRKELAKIYGDAAVNDKIRDLYTNYSRIFTLCFGNKHNMKPDHLLVEEHARLIQSRKLDDPQGLIDEVNFILYAFIEKDMMKAVLYGDKALKKASAEKLYHWSERANRLLKTRESRDIAAVWAERALKGLTDEDLIFNCEFVLDELKNSMNGSMSKGGRKKK